MTQLKRIHNVGSTALCETGHDGQALDAPTTPDAGSAGKGAGVDIATGRKSRDGSSGHSMVQPMQWSTGAKCCAGSRVGNHASRLQLDAARIVEVHHWNLQLHDDRTPKVKNLHGR